MRAQAAVTVGTMAWKKPELLAPENIAAVITAPARATVGWVEAAIVPAGEPLAEADARDLVMRWQAVKSSATGGALPTNSTITCAQNGNECSHVRLLACCRKRAPAVEMGG
jgi:hypothetical protein